MSQTLAQQEVVRGVEFGGVVSGTQEAHKTLSPVALSLHAVDEILH